MREYIRKDDFNFDWDEDCTTIEGLIEQYGAKRLTAEEIMSLGLGYASLGGHYGIYRTGNGIPDVVLNDFEIGRGPKARYGIEIYLIQERAEDLYDELYEILLNSDEGNTPLKEEIGHRCCLCGNSEHITRIEDLPDDEPYYALTDAGYSEREFVCEACLDDMGFAVCHRGY